ncbi:MAG: hypothetical protein K2K55_05715, partial [Duncaniella sp.]|nr:hypothetical protein [Duncaniella sp.]
ADMQITVMKRLPALLFVIAISISAVIAQESSQPDDTISDPVLNELRIIRHIQEESREHKKNAIIHRRMKDSIMNRAQAAELLSDYAIMSMIEENTHQDQVRDGWNLYGWVAFLIAGLSLLVSVYTLYSQRKTEGNTKKLSRDMQRKLLNELVRHLYRNLVIIYTMRTKMNDIGFDGYPSEEHFDKLKIPMNNIHLDSFYGEDANFQTMHNLYLNLRNYNEEIEVAKKHFVDPSLSRATKEEDLDTLEFKVSFLTERIIESIYSIWGFVDRTIEDRQEKKRQMDNEPRNRPLRDEIVKDLEVSLKGQTNAAENIDVEGSADFIRLTPDDFRKMAYGRLFDNERLKEVCDIFNRDIHEERKKNKRGAWKLRVIRY